MLMDLQLQQQNRRVSILCAHFSPSLLDTLTHSSQIVSSSNTSTFQLNCVFCQIIQGNSSAFKLYEDDVCLCILDTSPLSRGHSLLIPKHHFSSLDATPPSVIAAMCSKIPFISNAVKKATDCESFNLLVNNGASAGQVIFHTHIHIIPRKAHDRLWSSENLRRLSLKLDQEAPRLAETIREQILLANTEEEVKDQGSVLAAKL